VSARPPAPGGWWRGESQWFAAVAAAAALLMFWNLGGRSLENWDEAIYAQVSRELLHSGDWITLHWNFQPWYLKPPLYIWLEAVAFRVLGVGELAARLPSALAGVALVGVTMAIGARLRGAVVGILSGVVLVACYHLVAGARFGTTDVMLTLFIYLAVLAYLRAPDDPRWWLAVGASLGLAAMTKGVAALPAAAAIGLALAVDGRARRAFRRPEPWLGVGVAIAVALPWHLAAYLRSGPDFLAHYLGREVLARAAQPIEGHVGGWSFYLFVLRNHFFPWAYLVPFALLLHARDARRRRVGSSTPRSGLTTPRSGLRGGPGRGGPGWVLVTVPLAVFAVDTAVGTKLYWYLIPVYPALAVQIAGLLVDAARGDRVALGATFLAGALALGSVPHELPRYPELLGVAFIVAALVAVPAARIMRRPTAMAWTVVATAFFAAAGLSYVAPLLGSVHDPVVDVASAARGVEGQPLLVFAGDSGDIPVPVWPDALWYSDRRLVEAGSPDELATEVDATRTGQVLMLRRDRARLESRFVVLDLWDAGPYMYAVVRPRPTAQQAELSPVTAWAHIVAIAL
jgi:4-amino-4-deoxy-L-arabinose transferase-like glycosyltransferase